MDANNLEILECRRQTAYKHAGCAIPFEMELFGQRAAFEVVCHTSQITLKDIVHPARQLDEIIIRQALKHQLFSGKSITCSAGCMACCKYAVTVSPAEAFAIHDLIRNLPRPYRLELLRKMTIAGRKILTSFPSIIKSCGTGQNPASNSLDELSRWYKALNLTCPWLENKLCSHYTFRPLVCREFLVTSSSSCCNPNAVGGRVKVNIPVRMAEVLMEVCSKLLGSRTQAVFLPLVPAWCDSFADLQDRLFDAPQAAALLLDTIIAHQQKTIFITAK